MIPPILFKFASFIKAHLGFAKKKVEQKYIGYKMIRLLGLPVEEKDFTSVFNAALYEFEFNRVKHPLLIYLFKEPSAKSAFKSDYYSGTDNLLENDLTTNINVNEKYTDLRTSDVDIKKEIDEYIEIFATKVNESKTPQEIHASNELREIKKIVSALNISKDSIDLSTYLSEITNLRSDNEHGSVLKLLQKFKEKKWDGLSKELRYKVTLNFAVTYFELDQKKEGAKYFLQLLDYEIKVEESMGFAALGYALLGDNETAIKYANKTLILDNKNENAYLALLFSNDETIEIEDLDKLVPKEIQNSPGIAINIASIKEKKGDYEGAFEILKQLDEKHTLFDTFKIDLQVLLATNRIKSIESKDDFIFNQLEDDSIERVRYALEKLDRVWTNIKNTDLRFNRSYILTNRGVTHKLLGNINNAEQDFRNSLELNKTYFTYRHLLLLKTDETREYDKLLSEMEQLSLKSTEKQEMILFKVQKEVKDSQLKGALAHLLEELPNVINKEIEKEYYSAICDIYLITGDTEESEKYAFQFAEKYPEDPFSYYYLFKIFYKKNEKEKAIEYLLQAKNLITEKSARLVAVSIADAYLIIEEFQKAGEVLNKIAIKSKPSPITKKLIASYYRAGSFKDALDIINPLITNFPTDSALIDIQTAIFESLGQHDDAILSLIAYLKLIPDDKLMKVKLAMNYYKKADYANGKKVLDSMSDFATLPMDIQFMIADAYIKSKDYARGLDIAYNIRQNNLQSAVAHQKFLYLQVPLFDLSHEDFFPSKIAIDSHIVLTNQDGKNIEYVIVESPKFANEISISENLSKLLLDKAVGDCIDIGDERFTVNSIMWKYTYAFHDSMTQISTRFNDGPIRVMRLRAEGTPEEKLSSFFKSIDKGVESDNALLGFYQRGQTTIGFNARYSGISPIRYWGRLSCNPDVGIKSIGTFFESQMGITLLINNKSAILDITAILGLFHVELLHLLKNLPNTFYVAQSTIELINSEIQQLKNNPSKEDFYVNKVDGQYIKIVVSIEEKKKEIEKWEYVLKIIDEFAKPITPRADNNFFGKQEKDKILGLSFSETALVASQNDLLMLSDDLYFRQLCFNEYQVNGISTINFLPYLVHHHILAEGSTVQFLKKYIYLNYRFVPINENILIDCCVNTNFSVKQPFINACDVIDPAYLDDLQAIKLIGNFMYELYKSTSISATRSFIAEYILTKLFYGRDRNKIKGILLPFIDTKFRLLPIQRDDIMQIIFQQF